MHLRLHFHLFFPPRPRARRTNEVALRAGSVSDGQMMHEGTGHHCFHLRFHFHLFFTPRVRQRGQTFVSFRRFYFLIFGGNLICPSLTLPARKVKDRSPSPTTCSPTDFAFSTVFLAGNISDGQCICVFLRAGSVSDGQIRH